MYTIIEFFAHEQLLCRRKVLAQTISSSNLSLEATVPGDNHLLLFDHHMLNSFLHWSGTYDWQLLYFDKDDLFAGAAIARDHAQGDFVLVTQARKVILLKPGQQLSAGQLSRLHSLHGN